MGESASTRTKIAYLVPPSLDFAGVERVVHEIATGLAERHGEAFDVHVVYATRYDEELLRDTAYTLHVLGVARLRRLATAIRACVAQNKFDVLVCAQVEPSVLTWLATRGLGLPVFLTYLHGNPRIEERRGSRRTRVAFVLFRRVISKRISGILVVSPSLKRYVEHSLAPGTQVAFVPNAVREFNVPSCTASASGVFEFVTVARLSFQKGQDVLLRAVALARPRLPPFRLTLVGSGPDEEQLRSLARSLDLDDVVRFAGYVSDPAQYLAAADCFVLPSRWEGFGVVLIEALRFGLPLLATDCEFGPADVITDPSLGDLVEPDSPESLAESLVRAASCPRRAEDVEHRQASAEQYSRRTVAFQHAATLRRFTARLPRR